MQWKRSPYILTTEPMESSVAETFQLLQSTYWSHKRPKDVVAKVIENSLCFYLLHDGVQVGFARIISDFATTSWLADVVLVESHQNKGLGSWMMNCVMSHPDIQQTQFILQTGTASKFYEQLGFSKHESLMSTPVDYLQ